MNNKIIGIAIVGILFFAFPAAAQLPGDLNCDGYPWEISDLIIAVQILNAGCDAFILNCTYENGDMDGDGIPLTLGDIIPAPFIINGNPNWPDFPRHPESDTIMVESATTHPGEMLTLPLRIKTVDTLVAVQFLLEVDPDYFEFDSMIVYNGFPLTEYNCEGNIYGITNQDHNFPVVLLPGDHHIGDIIISVNPDINQPVTTGLYFSSTPHRALYSGFANSDFFLPVMVDAEIEIIPLTEIESEGEITPSRFEISVYPNPFNNALNISVFSDQPTEISVYDIMGRPVKTFAIAAGNNLVKWNA
ncbi:MAG: T9SS type A sorting domain-containing protein, partial [Candidatus Zixiibacteriota bacterium]